MERRLAAILAADVVGYTRLMGADEAGTLRRLTDLRRELLEPVVGSHHGRIVKLMGDGLLVEFASVVDAVSCALAWQDGVAKREVGADDDEPLQFRIGINLGDVIVDDGDIHGDGVNIAARLEGLAEPGGICISQSVHTQIKGKVDLDFEDLGEQDLKNVAEPVRLFRIAGKGAGKARSALTRGHLPLPDKPSIAVLPFTNMSGDPEQDYLADGIVEAITAALSRIRSFFVIARNSAFTYKGRAVNVHNVGDELGVAYLLEGSVQRAGNRIRITVQLNATDTGSHVWAERYDGSLDDIFDLQDRITEQVAGALQPSIRLAEIERARRKRPQDLGAYGYAMQAMPHVWALEKMENDQAIELLDKALEIDPTYPLALSLAGWCHAQRSVYNYAEDIVQAQARALELAERAATLSNDDPLILAVLGTVQTFVRNHGTARLLLDRALALDPNAAWAWSRLAWLETYSDQPETALEHFKHALRLSPLDPINFNNYAGMGCAHQVAENYDQAVQLFRRALQERPHADWIYRNLAPSLVGAGQMEEAKRAYARLMESYSDLTISKLKEAMVFSPAVLERIGRQFRQLGMPD